MKRSTDGPTRPTDLSEEQIREAERNVERCLEALDERDEAGLQAELDRIYPGTNASEPPGPETPAETSQFVKVPMGNLPFPANHMLVLRNGGPVIPVRKPEASSLYQYAQKLGNSLGDKDVADNEAAADKEK